MGAAWAIVPVQAVSGLCATLCHREGNGDEVLDKEIHGLSRQFATPADDKFAGIECKEGPSRVPIIGGALAHFVCRNVRHIEAGDHMIVIGEVERFDTSDGEPLVFHSGSCRVVTRHPDLEPN